jgi:hypothetical protein
MSLLELLPAGCKARLGHATFLDPAAQLIVLNRKHAVEICLSSNLLYVYAHLFEALELGFNN